MLFIPHCPEFCWNAGEHYTFGIVVHWQWHHRPNYPWITPQSIIAHQNNNKVIRVGHKILRSYKGWIQVTIRLKRIWEASLEHIIRGVVYHLFSNSETFKKSCIQFWMLVSILCTLINYLPLGKQNEAAQSRRCV